MAAWATPARCGEKATRIVHDLPGASTTSLHVLITIENCATSPMMRALTAVSARPSLVTVIGEGSDAWPTGTVPPNTTELAGSITRLTTRSVGENTICPTTAEPARLELLHVTLKRATKFEMLPPSCTTVRLPDGLVHGAPLTVRPIVTPPPMA